MTQVNMLEAKTHLTKLIKLLETRQEDEVYIARAGKQIVKMTLVDPPREKRTGLFNGQSNSIGIEQFNAFDKEIWGDLY